MRTQHRWWKGVGAVPLLLSGCAAPESGTATTRVEIQITVKDCSLDNGAAITLTPTATTTPTSQADQAAETSVDAQAEVPLVK